MKTLKIVIAVLASILIIAIGGIGIFAVINSKEEPIVSEEVEIRPEEEQPEQEEPDNLEKPEEKKDEVVTVTLSAAGDVTLGNTQLQGYEGTFIEMYDNMGPSYFLSKVLPIFEADDMTLVNFEGVLTDYDQKMDKEFNLKGRPEFMQILNDGSVECVAFANNHRRDYYDQGSDDTVEGFKNYGITYAYDTNTAIYEVKGIKMGYISVNTSHGEDVLDMVKNGVTELRMKGANCIIVYIHWGIELDHYPQTSQEQLGHEMIDLGVDLVLGAHPHVLQGIEIYHGKPIVYSLGNFCFGGNKNPKRKNTMIYQQTFTFVNGQLQEGVDAKVIPCTISTVDWRNDFCPMPQTGERAKEILKEIQTYSEPWNTAIDELGTFLLP